MSYYLILVLNSIAYGALMFLMASGFSLIFGLMKITNMTHSVFYMMGAYLGITFVRMWGSFTLATLVAAIIVTGIGLVVFRFFLFKLQGNQQSQVLLCMGFQFFFDDLLLVIFGGTPMSIPIPELLSGSIPLLDRTYSIYRLFLILVGIVVMIALYLIIEKTKLGCLVRSGVDDEETTRAMGVDINKLFFLVYGGGTFLAGVGGVLGDPWLGMEPRMCFTLMPMMLSVVIIGGLGNLRGAFWGSMIVGLLYAFGSAIFPDYSYFVLFLPVALVLAFKPNGLFKN